MPGFDIVGRPPEMPQRDILGEGALWEVAAQALWWVDIVGRRVQRFHPGSGEMQQWSVGSHVSSATPCCSGGLMLSLPDGLFRMALPSGELTPFARPDADADNRSNECRVDPQGRLWLGTMANNLHADGSPRPITRASGGLFRIDSDGGCVRVLSDIGISNTLVWSPAGDLLYFADSLLGVIWSFRFDPEEGRLSDRRVFAPPDAADGAPDGSAMDEEGCLWNARWGGSCVARFTPQGRVDRVIALPALHPTSVAFGGPDLKTLYVTSAREGAQVDEDSLDGSLFAVPAPVAGLPSPRFAA